MLPARYRQLLCAQRDASKNLGASMEDLRRYGCAERVQLWATMFGWALPCKALRSRYDVFRNSAILAADARQIALDVPRTLDWFAETQVNVTLDALTRVLTAYVAAVHACSVAPREPKYVQGQNVLAMICLHVFDGDEQLAFAYLHGICQELLAEVFGRELGRDMTSGAGSGDALDATRRNLEELLRKGFPEASRLCEEAGLSTGMLAVKWVMTLFSNTSFACGSSDTMPLETVLSCWDVCLLMGEAGLAAVVLALFGFVEPSLYKTSGSIEEISLCFSESLRGLSVGRLYAEAARHILSPKAENSTMYALREAHGAKVRKLDLKARRKLSFFGASQKPFQLLSDDNDDDDNDDDDDDVEEQKENADCAVAVAGADCAVPVCKGTQQLDWLEHFDEDKKSTHFVHVDGHIAHKPPTVGYIARDGRLVAAARTSSRSGTNLFSWLARTLSPTTGPTSKTRTLSSSLSHEAPTQAPTQAPTLARASTWAGGDTAVAAPPGTDDAGSGSG